MEQPFVVGQEIVALCDAVVGRRKVIKKGQVFIVLGIVLCHCNRWIVDVGILTPAKHTWGCSRCDKTFDSRVWWALHIGFAPVTRITREEKIEVDKSIKELEKCLS